MKLIPYIAVAILLSILALFAFWVFPVAAEQLFGKSNAAALAEKELDSRGLKATLHSVDDYGNGRYGVIYLDGPRRIDVSVEHGKVTRFYEGDNPHAKYMH